MPKPTWAARLPHGMAEEAWEFLHSLPYDGFLWPFDIDGTAAHVSALVAAGVLSAAEGKRLRTELKRMRDHPELIEASDEDVHSAIERVLTERLGGLGASVHAGRSRNDQVATALRLWVKEEVRAVRGAVSRLTDVLASRAEEHAATPSPGYTHLQRAQPVTLGHSLCAHAWSFVRDLERLDAAHRAADVSPLGAGALAGSTLGIKPSSAAAELGFSDVFVNSIDAVADRDFLVDGVYACSMALIHLSRLAEEIVLWSSSEFAFVKLPDAYATGSSMMPQKKNPDVAELARGSSGVAVGALTGLLVTLKSLPLAYDRDLQTDKQHARDVFVVTRRAFSAMAGLMNDVEFDVDRLGSAAADPGLLATDAAEELVRGGTPFRRAHEAVAARVRSGEILRGDASASLRSRSSPGGPSPRSVRAQVRSLRKALS
jgi:argininosuccinate lyase